MQLPEKYKEIFDVSSEGPDERPDELSYTPGERFVHIH
jgi:hypothetical protein